MSSNAPITVVDGRTPESEPRNTVQTQQEQPVLRVPAETNTELVRFQFKDVDKMMAEGYSYQTSNNSTICDIVAMYLKGQKILYTESKTLCEMRLHYLMLPAILITASAAILSMILKDNPNGATVVSVLNSINTFLLTLINYLKLDARSEAHRTAAYKFDKLQSYMEFNSGRMLFDKEVNNQLVEILKKVENDVREIKETNQFILPEKIRYEYPKLYSTNVFAEVKKIMNREALAVESMKTAMNNILELEADVTQGKLTEAAAKPQIAVFEMQRKAEVQNVLLIKNLYLGIDATFEKELETHRGSFGRRFDCCGWLKS